MQGKSTHCCSGHSHDCHDHNCACHEHDGECHEHDGECHSCDCECHSCDCEGVPDPEACRQPLNSPAFAHQDPNKGVSLGAELERDIAEVMTKRYGRFLRPTETFHVTTEVCHHFGLVSSELRSEDRRVFVEVSVECEPNKIDNPMDAYQEALDDLDLVWLDYFDSERISHYLPIWQSYEIGKKSVNVRLEHSNPALDDEASAFLLAHGFTEGGLEPEDDSEE